MNYSNLKEDVICIVNSYLGVLIIELLHPRCIDLFVEPLTSTSLGIGGIFLSSGKTFTYTLSLNVTESGTILIMLTDGFGLLKKILWSKEFRHLSEFFAFLETRFSKQLDVAKLNNINKYA